MSDDDTAVLASALWKGSDFLGDLRKIFGAELMSVGEGLGFKFVAEDMGSIWHD